MTRKTDHRDAAKSQSGENYQTFLRAARDGDLNYVIKLLNSGIKINVSNQIGLNALHLAAKENHIEIVNELIRRSCDVEAVTKKGNTPLHIASLAGNYEIVKILLDNGANVNKQSLIGFTPLYMAAQENHLEIVNMLLSRGADQALTTNDGFTPLAVALQQGHEKVVTILLEKDNTSRYSLPALHIAARKDDVNSVNLLLSNPNANVNHQSMTGFTPLHIAAHYGNVNVASCLIAKKADVNFQARNNITPLHVAAKWGKTKMASLLLKNQALIDCKTRDGLTPLHCAARSGFSDICELLMDSGAHPSATTRNGLTPLHMAAQGNNDEVARILILRGAGLEDITGDYLSPLHVAAHCGNEKVAAILLQTGCDVNPRALNGFTPLHIACKKGREGMVDLLIKHNSQISSTTELGLSPLHVSAFIGNAKIVQKLLNAGASVDQTTMRSETPLHLAVRNCQMEAAEALIAKRAKIDAPAKDNETPLHIAVFAGHLDLVTLLLKNGANPNFPTKDAFTALHFAAKSGNIDIIRTLLDSGANMLARHKKGFTCLHFAAKHGRLKAAKMLLNHCQKTFSKSEYSNFVNAKARNDLTAIHIATHYNKLEMVQLLIDHDSDLYCRVSNGYSLLHIAAKYNHSDIATLILAQDIDQKKELPNSQSNCGFTPLHLATQAGYCDMVSLLLQHSANVDHQSKNGLSALHLAAQEDRVPVAQVLVAAKCKLSPTTLAGYTPLHTAAHFGQVNMVRFLLNQSGVGVNEKMSSGFSPLHLASQQGHSKVVQLLIDTGADPNIKNQNGLTAAHLAQQKHYVSIFDQLKKLTTSVKSWDMTNIKEQYQLEKPEVMGEIVGSESEDETAIYMNDVQDQMQIQRQMVDESFSNGIVPFEVSPSQNDSSIPSKGKLLKPPSEMDESDLVEVNIDYWKQMTYTDDDQINMKNILTISPGAILHHTNDESFNSNEISLGKERMIEYTNLPPSPVFNRSNKDTLSKNTSMRDEFTMDGSFHENSFKTMSSVTSPVQNMSSGDYDKFSPINRNGENEWAFETTNMEVIRKPIESCNGKEPLKILNFKPGKNSFLASFLVDARGCLLQAQRYPLLKIFIPPNAVTGPTRILMRLNRIPVAIPQLNDGDGLGCRIIEMSPVGLKFNSPVLFEIPYNADIEANDREMIVLRSENGSSWKEQGVDPSNHAIQQSLGSYFENVLPKEELKQNRVHRILTHDIPQYFALITRIKQDLVLIGPEGGFIHSTVVPTVRSEFPPGALQKRIRVGLQAQTIKPELVSKIAGNRVSVSPIVTIEPRRRKFHKPIVLTIPLPKTIAEMVQQTGKSTNLNEISSLRLLCSISGGTAPAFWEDITGSTMLNLVKNCAQFTTTVSARLWLFDCPNIPEVAELATKIYREASAVPYIGRMAIYGKRMDAEEAQLRCIMLTDDNIDKTLECQEGFHLLCTSPETQVLQNHTYWLETSGNLIPISKAAKQLSIGVRAFEENRLNLSVRMKNPYEAPCGKFAFVHSPKWSVSENESKGGHDDKPITILDLTLPQVGIAPKLPYSASNTPKLDHQAGFNKLSSMNNNNESPADLAKSDLNLKSLADNIKNDWERVARSLGVDNAPIAKKHQGNDYEAAYATLLEWQRMNPTSTGNQLKTALEKSGHGEIIKSSMSNVKLIKNEREINSALKELQPEIIRELVSNGKEATADDQLVPHIVSRHKEVKIEKVDPAVRQKNRMEIENILAQDFKNTLDLGPPVKDETVPKVEEEIIRAVVKEKSPIVIPKDAEDIIMPKQSQVVKSTEPAIYLKEDIERGNTKPSSDIGKVEESIKPKSSSAHHASVIEAHSKESGGMMETISPLISAGSMAAAFQTLPKVSGAFVEEPLICVEESHVCGEHESTWGKPQGYETTPEACNSSYAFVKDERTFIEPTVLQPDNDFIKPLNKSETMASGESAIDELGSFLDKPASNEEIIAATNASIISITPREVDPQMECMAEEPLIGMQESHICGEHESTWGKPQGYESDHEHILEDIISQPINASVNMASASQARETDNAIEELGSLLDKPASREDIIAASHTSHSSSQPIPETTVNIIAGEVESQMECMAEEPLISMQESHICGEHESTWGKPQGYESDHDHEMQDSLIRPLDKSENMASNSAIDALGSFLDKPASEEEIKAASYVHTSVQPLAEGVTTDQMMEEPLICVEESHVCGEHESTWGKPQGYETTPEACNSSYAFVKDERTFIEPTVLQPDNDSLISIEPSTPMLPSESINLDYKPQDSPRFRDSPNFFVPSQITENMQATATSSIADSTTNLKKTSIKLPSSTQDLSRVEMENSSENLPLITTKAQDQMHTSDVVVTEAKIVTETQASPLQDVKSMPSESLEHVTSWNKPQGLDIIQETVKDVNESKERMGNAERVDQKLIPEYAEAVSSSIKHSSTNESLLNLSQLKGLDLLPLSTKELNPALPQTDAVDVSNNSKSSHDLSNLNYSPGISVLLPSEITSNVADTNVPIAAGLPYSADEINIHQHDDMSDEGKITSTTFQPSFTKSLPTEGAPFYGQLPLSADFTQSNLSPSSDPSNDTVVPSHHPQCGEHESTWGKPQDCSFDGLDMMPKTEESTKSPKKSLNEKKKKK